MNALKIFNHFDSTNIRNDVMGGITAAVVSLPLALTFGVASGAGPEAGLYGAILIGLFASLFGGTPTLISEPTGPMTVTMTAVIASLIATNPEKGMAMAFTVVMIAGVFQIVLGCLKLGRYVTLMPYSVISGFMSGIGVILILLQLPSFLGQSGMGSSVLGTLQSFPTILTNISYKEAMLGVIALAILFFTPKKIASFFPPQLIALLAGTIISLILFEQTEVRRVGEISLGLPTVHMPTFTSAELVMMLVNGLVLGALGCIDSLLTSVISDSLTRQEHKPNKELIGQGIANTISGIFGGLPGAGATMGTVVNIQVGARSAYSGVTRAVVLFVVLVGAAELAELIPMAVLAAIAIKVGINILDWSFVKKAHRVCFSATFVMYTVLILTVFVDLIVAVGVGMFIANLITIERLSLIQEKNIRLISESDDHVHMSEVEKALLEKIKSKTHVIVVYFSGPMIFGVSKALRREAQSIDKAEALVLDMSDAPLVDATISLAIENMLLEASEKNCLIYLVKPRVIKPSHQTRYEMLASMPGVNLASNREEAFRQLAELKSA